MSDVTDSIERLTEALYGLMSACSRLDAYDAEMYADEIKDARNVLSEADALASIKQTDAVEAERAWVVLREVGRLALSSPDSKTCCQIEQIVRQCLVKRGAK